MIGSSHLACWKWAWDDWDKQSDQVALTFFGANGRGIGDFKVRAGRLVPGSEVLLKSVQRTSGGITKIEVDRFTDFVIVGLHFGFHRVLPLFQNHGLFRHLGYRPSVNLMSSACVHKSIDSLLLGSPAMGLRDKIRALTDKPIFLATTPCLAEVVLQKGSDYRSGAYCAAFGPVLETEYLSDIFSIFEQRARRIAAEADVELLMQEAVTMAYPGFTRLEYNENGLGFSSQRSGFLKLNGQDVSHMNRDYGRVCLEQLCRSLPV